MKRLLLIVLLLCPQPAWAAYALVAHTIAGSSDSNTVTSSAINTTGATILFAPCAWYPGPGSAGTPTVTDSKSNTWTYRTTYTTGAGNQAVRIAYAVNPTVGSGHTFTCTSTSSFPTIAPVAFSGAKLTLPYDTENGASANGTTVEGTGSITPSEGSEVVIAFVGWALHSDTTVTINAGLTILDQITLNGASHDGAASAYVIQTTASAVSPLWSFSNSSSNNEETNATIASFKAAVAGPPPSTSLMVLGVGH